jgi:hypothetical protein
MKKMFRQTYDSTKINPTSKATLKHDFDVRILNKQYRNTTSSSSSSSKTLHGTLRSYGLHPAPT